MTAATTRRRSGGRAARRELRAQGSSGEVVGPGLKGGTFKPLGERDIQRIHQTALDVLENVGVGDPLPEMIETAFAQGLLVERRGAAVFPARAGRGRYRDRRRPGTNNRGAVGPATGGGWAQKSGDREARHGWWMGTINRGAVRPPEVSCVLFGLLDQVSIHSSSTNM